MRLAGRIRARRATRAPQGGPGGRGAASWWRGLALLTVALLAPAPSLAAGDIDERADRLLRAMSEHLKAARSFTFRADVLLNHVLASGQKLEFSRHADVWVRRPDRLHLDIAGDLAHERVWYDGRKVTRLELRERAHEEIPAPDSIDATLDLMAAQHDMTSPVADFVYSDPYAELTRYARSGRYVGLHEAAGVRAHHLAFRQEHVDWQIWIEDGPEPLPRKLVITYKKVPGAPVFRVTMSAWDLDARLADAAFEAITPHLTGGGTP